MKKNENDKTGEGNHFLAGYGWQALIAPCLAVILLSIFYGVFGCDANLFWINVLVLATWLLGIFIAFLFRPNGETWRNYRWIIAPAMIILLFLFDVSWAQSTLATSSLEKNVFKIAPLGSLQIHAEYPPQIFFEDTEPNEVHLWVTDISSCVNVEISGSGLLFAVKPPSDEPLEWSEKLTLKFNSSTTAVTLLVQPSQLPATNSQRFQLNLNSGGELLETSGWEVTVESKRDSQIRSWKTNFLSTGGTIVSLITAIFVGIKQLEEEKKRQKAERVKQAIATSDTDAKSDFSKMLQEHLDLTADWSEWDIGLQEQFRKLYSSSFEKKLWTGLSAKTTAEVISDVNLCIQVCVRIFKDEKEAPIPTLKYLQSAFQTDEGSPRALLSMLKAYPASIEIAKQIASAFSQVLKTKAINSGSEFTEQILDLKDELGFSDTSSFPLQGQFVFFAKPHTSEDKLTVWLKARELDYSPFADAASPFYSVPEKLLLMDSVSSGFAFPPFNLRNVTFKFTNLWDAGAALFEYCKSLQGAVKAKEETFFVAVTPSLIEDRGMDQTRKLYLHALAEQWVWTLAETPTAFYSLKDDQRDLIGRLLRWHDLSPSITVNKIARYIEHFRETKNQTVLSSKIMEWLTIVSSDDLRAEEANALIGLRPLSKQRTLFLISAIDLNPHVDRRISSDLREQLGAQSDWLSAHDCSQVHFQIGKKNRALVPQFSLITQCNNRIRVCSQNKVDAFNFLFDPHNRKSAEIILARKAGGSPGKMVRLGQQLLLQHVDKHSPDENLHIEDLIALK